MRRDNYAEDLYRLDNEYRGLLIKIRTVRRRNDDLPSAEEGRAYQRAAEICGMIANMSVGAEAEHWKAEQAKCSDKIREIAFALDPTAAKMAEQAASGTGVASSGNGAKAETVNAVSGSSGSGNIVRGIETDEVVTESIINGWFKDAPEHGLDSVAGMDDVKDKLRKCFTSVGMAKLKQRLKISPIQGYFFIGPPGCGKTYIIKAFANELMKKYGYNYMFLSGGAIHNRYVGDAEKIVEKAFLAARENAPCIMFIDEMDGVCRNRSAPNLPAHMLSTTTAFLNGYNSLLDKMDPEKPVIFMAATNYPQDVDTAMLDRTELIEISLPDDKARESAFARGFKHLTLGSDITFEDMAAETVNYNYRDIDRVRDSVLTTILNSYIDSGVECEDAIRDLDEGAFMLTKDLFYNAVDNYTPAPKEEYMRKLEEWKQHLKDEEAANG